MSKSVLKSWKKIALAMAIMASSVGVGLTVVAENSPADAWTEPCHDSDGDGYGWDGHQTCRMNNPTQATSTNVWARCVDSDGDGWGWATHEDGRGASCRGSWYIFSNR